MGWIKFDDAYQCHINDMIEYRKKQHWPVRCPDCKEWIIEPTKHEYHKFGWTAYNHKQKFSDSWSGQYFSSVTHFFKECECGAQLTVFVK